MSFSKKTSSTTPNFYPPKLTSFVARNWGKFDAPNPTPFVRNNDIIDLNANVAQSKIFLDLF
jgi:hypothetical protein